MISRILNGLAAVLGAGLFAQFPAFYQQYLQRLGGRLDQARLDLDRILQDAAILGRTLEAYIEELLNSGTMAARLAAQRELERVQAADELQSAYEALALAEPLERPFVFARHFDSAVAADTFRAFEAALPVTPEGFVYVAVGIGAGLALMAGGEWGARGLLRRLRSGGSGQLKDAGRHDA